MKLKLKKKRPYLIDKLIKKEKEKKNNIDSLPFFLLVSVLYLTFKKTYILGRLDVDKDQYLGSSSLAIYTRIFGISKSFVKS